MADAMHIAPSAIVYPIPQGSAPGEISPVIPLGMSYPGVAEGAVTDPDADLVALIARHKLGCAASERAETQLAEALARFRAAKPKRPATLYWRIDDPQHASGSPEATGRIHPATGKTTWWRPFLEKDIKELRAAPDPTLRVERYEPFPGRPGESIVRVSKVPDPDGIARKAEILAAWDTWFVECGEVAQRVGWCAAATEDKRVKRDLLLLTNEIEDTQPKTLAGLAARRDGRSPAKSPTFRCGVWHGM